MVHFARETIGRLRRAGAKGRINVRADSGFWSYAMLVALNQRGVGWSITARLNKRVKARISRIEEDAWASIDYPRDGEAQVAETEYEMTNPQKRSEKLKVPFCMQCAMRLFCILDTISFTGAGPAMSDFQS